MNQNLEYLVLMAKSKPILALPHAVLFSKVVAHGSRRHSCACSGFGLQAARQTLIQPSGIIVSSSELRCGHLGKAFSVVEQACALRHLSTLSQLCRALQATSQAESTTSAQQPTTAFNCLQHRGQAFHPLGFLLHTAASTNQVTPAASVASTHNPRLRKKSHCHAASGTGAAMAGDRHHVAIRST